MTGAGLQYLLERGVARITLDRPARLNALTTGLLTAFGKALDHAERDGARAVLITGTGRAFCSGADLVDAAATASESPASAIEDHYNPLARRLEHYPVPVVVAVNGVAAGAGFSLAMLGDVVLMAESASLLAAFVHLGLAPDFGATWTITRRAGLGRALEIMMLGERIPARQACAWGLVNRVVPDADLPAAAGAMAEQLAGGPTVALGLIRKAARAALVQDFDHVLTGEVSALRQTAGTKDVRRAIAAFSKRERVTFSGR